MTLCWGCHRIKEIVHTDALARKFCAACFDIELSGSTEPLARRFLEVSVPFEPGDHVECRTAGERYDGTGVITRVSMDLKDGGTPVYPVFYVVFDPDEDLRDVTNGIYCENDLRKVS